jgi:hypothetical protein
MFGSKDFDDAAACILGLSPDDPNSRSGDAYLPDLSSLCNVAVVRTMIKCFASGTLLPALSSISCGQDASRKNEVPLGTPSGVWEDL